MKRLFAVFALLTLAAQPALARERFYLQFELFDGAARLNSGAAVVSDRARTWSRGLKRNYLVLSCEPDRNSVVRRHYSTFRDFVGPGITHQVVDKELVLRVSRSTEERRIRQIRAMSGDECRDLRPVITTTDDEFRIPVDKVGDEPVAFGDGLRFEFTMTPLGRQR